MIVCAVTGDRYRRLSNTRSYVVQIRQIDDVTIIRVRYVTYLSGRPVSAPRVLVHVGEHSNAMFVDTETARACVVNVFSRTHAQNVDAFS